jgi:hypothetical protein
LAYSENPPGQINGRRFEWPMPKSEAIWVNIIANCCRLGAPATLQCLVGEPVVSHRVTFTSDSITPTSSPFFCATAEAEPP